MKSWNDLKELKSLREEIKSSGILENKPGKLSSISRYFQYMGYSYKLMFKEKELFVFVLFQWLSVLMGYYLFVMMLYWIPPEVWESVEDSDGEGGSIADLVLFLWMFVCIGVATMPLGIASACMMVTHFLHIEGKPSTVAACLKAVLPRLWGLWLFTWLDGYITVNRIIERLPKKNDRTPRAAKLLAEALYYAWKVATMGILPNIVTGRSIKDTTKNTVGMIKNHAMDILMVRAGYSLMCWIVGVGTYVLGILNFGWIQDTFLTGDMPSDIANFYMLAGVPLLIAVAVIQIFLRPPYLLAISDIYSQYMTNKGEHVLESEPPAAATSAIVAFGIVCLGMLIVFLFREQLGIMDMLATPYGEDYTPKN